LLWHDVC
jgi:hypothetical protein